MRQVVLKAPGELRVVDVPFPEVGPADLLVRPSYVGICGSDLEVYAGQRQGRFAHGHTLIGHEVSGVVECVGDRVEFIRPGDHVVLVDAWGAFSEVLVTRPENALRLPPEMDLADAALLEVMPGVMEAATRTGIHSGSDVLIVGAGLSGLLLTRLVALHGCRRLVVIDPSSVKLARAREFGAHDTVKGRLPDAAHAVTDLCPHGFDRAIIATRGAEPLRGLEKLTRPRGAIVIYGGLSPGAAVDFYSLHRRSISLLKESTAVTGTLEAREMWYTALRLVTDGLLPLRSLRTAVFPMSRLSEAFAMRLDPQADALHVIVHCDWEKEL